MAFRCFQKSSHVALDNEPQTRKTQSDSCLKRSHAPPRIRSSSRNITASSIDPEPLLADDLAISTSGSYRISIIDRNQIEDMEEISIEVGTGASISAKPTSPTRDNGLSNETKGRKEEAIPPDTNKPEIYSWDEAEQDKESLAKWKGKQRKSSKQEDENALVAQARFETACQLLHKRILEKEHCLTVSERSFLNRLLDDENGGDNEPDISDRLSAIEESLLALDDHPLFKTPPSSPDKMMRAKIESRGAAITDRNANNRSDQSQSSEEGSRSIEVLSTNSSHFSIEKALVKASEDKEENDLFRAHDTFRPSWGYAENRVYTAFSREPEDELQITEPPKPHRVAGSSARRRTPECMRKVADELDSGSPFPILGIIPRNRILSAHLMEALRGFLPDSVAEQNYWLKYNSLRDKTTMTSLLTKIRASQNTIICIKATDGSVFGSSTSTPWRLQKGWYGGGDINSESFLFRSLSGKMEVYPYTGSDNFVQYCSAQILAIGGGDWQQGDSPYSRNESNGIGLLIDGDLAGGESNSCATFANPRLFDRGDGTGCIGNEFSIEHMEVWTFTPCSDVVSAEKMELRRLFLEKHATATATTPST